MTLQTAKHPPMLIAAYIFLAAGIIGLSTTLLAFNDLFFRSGLLHLFGSLLCLGSGEVLNHRKELLITGDVQESQPTKPSYHRRRNTCALGNLLDIAALILLLTGFSSFM